MSKPLRIKDTARAAVPDPLLSLLLEYREESKRYNAADLTPEQEDAAAEGWARIWEMGDALPHPTTRAGAAEAVRTVIAEGGGSNGFADHLLQRVLTYLEGTPEEAAHAVNAPDPIFAAIAARRLTKVVADDAEQPLRDTVSPANYDKLEAEYDRAYDVDKAALVRVATTVPTTLEGFFAQTRYAYEVLKESLGAGGGDTLGDWRPGDDDDARTLEEMFLTSLDAAASAMAGRLAPPTARTHDPVFAAITEYRSAWTAFWGCPSAPDRAMNALCRRHSLATLAALQTMPTTLRGLRAYCEFGAELVARQHQINEGAGLVGYVPGAPRNTINAEALFMQTLADATRRLLPEPAGAE